MRDSPWTRIPTKTQWCPPAPPINPWSFKVVLHGPTHSPSSVVGRVEPNRSFPTPASRQNVDTTSDIKVVDSHFSGSNLSIASLKLSSSQRIIPTLLNLLAVMSTQRTISCTALYALSASASTWVSTISKSESSLSIPWESWSPSRGV